MSKLIVSPNPHIHSKDSTQSLMRDVVIALIPAVICSVLFYGWKNDILSDPEDVFRMGIANFAPIAKAEGCLIIQAHPYRRGCTPAIACYLDGVEVINTSPRHESYNERAAEYAEQFGLIATSGSDCHRPEDVARGGIITSKVPSDSMEMMRLIRSRDFELIGK